MQLATSARPGRTGGPRHDRPAPAGFKTEIRYIENRMTAEIFDLEAERAKRAVRPPKATPSVPATPSIPPQWRFSQRGNPCTTVDGYHIVVFKRGRSWGFRIELIGTEREWYSERRYQTEDAARSDALLAVQQLGRAPRQA